MPHLLNFKYEIFPTAPQKDQLHKILRQVKIQWNKAVTIRRKLKQALTSGQFEYVIDVILAAEKDNNQGQRRRAINNILALHPKINRQLGPKLYDLKNLAGNLLDDFGPKYLDISLLAKTLKNIHEQQVQQGKQDMPRYLPPGKQAKLTVFRQLMSAINSYAGYSANRYMTQSYCSSRRSSGMSLASIRANISGYTNSVKWNTAVNPSVEQRRNGATGDPKYKRRGEGFTYQVQNRNADNIIRKKTMKRGHQVYIKALHKGNAWIDVNYHRSLPEDGKIKQITINEHAGHFFAVFSMEVPDRIWFIAPMNAGWHAGIDPGIHIPLTIALRNIHTGDYSYMAVQYKFIEKSAARLEKMQQCLAKKQGPMRKRTEAEVREALERIKNKRAFKKLSDVEKEKTIEKEKLWLERTMIKQEASKKWLELNRKTCQIQYRIANQRRDVLHKISRTLAESCDLVGIGNWEPECEILYSKQIKALTKKVKQGNKRAAKTFYALKDEKFKQNHKADKKFRRERRDRSIATLRHLIEEKAQRSGAKYQIVNEAGTTIRCCICNQPTGPKGDLSVREWKCDHCHTVHNRDLNSAFNILLKAERVLAAAQAAAPITEQNVTRTKIQGATGKPERNHPGFRATGSSGKGGPHISGLPASTKNHFEPKLFEGDVPKALKSLKQMGIISTLTFEKAGNHALPQS